MKRRAHSDDDAQPPRELLWFNPRRHVTAEQMADADRYDFAHPGLLVPRSTKVQLDAFWRWMADRDAWAAEHGWTDDEMDQAQRLAS